MGPRQRTSLVAAAVLATSGPASAAPSWAVKGSGAQVYVETVSRTGRSRLVIDCQETVRLSYYVTRGWDGYRLDAVVLAIDGERLPVSVEGTDAAAILSDLPNDDIGISAAMLARIKAGRELVVDGSATRKVPAGERTFALESAAPAIEAFERRCPAARRR